MYDSHDEVYYGLRRADGTPLAVPAWMTRPEAARAKIVSTARLPVRVLLELRRVSGLRADRFVSEQLMQSLAPFGIEAAIEAIESLQGASVEQIQQKALALEHARYEVTRTRRQYNAVDPANRLVAAELERRWNQALTTEAQIEAELVTLQQGREHTRRPPQDDGSAHQGCRAEP